MSGRTMTRRPVPGLAVRGTSVSAPEADPLAGVSLRSFADTPPLNAAAARVRIAPNGAREEAFGYLLGRMYETARFTAAAESAVTEELLEAVQGAAAAPDRQQIAEWTPVLEAILRVLCENSGRIVRLHGPDAEAAVLHGTEILHGTPAPPPELGRLRRLAHAISTILDLAGDAP